MTQELSKTRRAIRVNDEAYRVSSPICFASGLKETLPICHGMVDTNVHFEDSVPRVEKLIELRKDNWELTVYRVENHGFLEPASRGGRVQVKPEVV